ncbi:MAG: hypothetical protein HY287_08125 [Planctomycetes bacterium]|nr:hypothetical protein [Planctomycetota bacterium]
MLETVIAVGLLVVGLAVIGAQIQDTDVSIRKMRLKTKALMLAEQQLAYLDLGLVKLDTIAEVQEGDFGPRYPDWGWRLTTQPTSLDGIFRQQLSVLYKIREERYQPDTFDYKKADAIFDAYAFHPNPKPLDLQADFGMTDKELTDLNQKVSDNQIPCFDGGTFNPTCLATLDSEQLLKALPVAIKLFPGANIDQLEQLIPPDVLKQLKDAGLLGDLENAAGGGGGKDGGPSSNPKGSGSGSSGQGSSGLGEGNRQSNGPLKGGSGQGSNPKSGASGKP